MWIEKAHSCPPGAVADHLRTELNRFRDLAPSLKHVRGDSFQPEHWRSLFNKLSMEKIKLADLCLSHFLEVAQAIVENAAALSELNARALGEVAIREAITEVKTLVGGDAVLSYLARGEWSACRSDQGLEGHDDISLRHAVALRLAQGLSLLQCLC